MDWIIGIGMMALGIAVVVLLWRNYCLRKEAAQFAGKVEQALDAIVTGKEWKRQGELTDSLWDRIETQLAKAEHVFQRKQEESLREKETVKGLISDISHQTRTPLANMKLYVELLEEETLSGGGDRISGKAVRTDGKNGFSDAEYGKNVPAGDRDFADPAGKAGSVRDDPPGCCGCGSGGSGQGD